MKQNISLLVAFALGAVFAGCVKEEADESDGNLPGGCQKTVFTTVVPEFTDVTDTKTHLEGLDVKWDIGDEFIVMDSKHNRYVAVNTKAGDIAVFTSDLTFDPSGGKNGKGKINELAETRAVVVYPASAATSESKSASYTAQMTKMNIPEKQSLLKNTFGRDANIAFASLSTGNKDYEYNGDRLRFYNACGLLRLRLRSLNGAKIKSISIIVPEGAALTGVGTVYPDMGGFLNTNANPFEGKREVVLVAEGEAIELTEEVVDFYACVMPATSNEFKKGADIAKTEKLITTGTGAKAGEYGIIFTDDRNRTLMTTVTLENGVHAGTVSTLGQFNISANSLNWKEPNPHVEDGLAYIFDMNALPEVHFTISLDEWNRLLGLYDENSHTSEYICCDVKFRKGDDVHYFKNGGVRLRGSTSRRRPEGSAGQMHNAENPDWHHCHFMLNTAKFNKKGADGPNELGGVRKIYFKWFKDDPTYAREIYCYDLFRKFGIWTQIKSSYCRLYVHVEGDKDEAYFGVYRMLEALDERYLKPRWQEFGHSSPDDEFNLWKCGNSASTHANLYDVSDGKFEHDDIAGDVDYAYILKTNLELEDGSLNFAGPKAQIVNFIENYKTLEGEGFRTWAEEVMDVRLLLRTYAVSVATGSWDDYWHSGKNFYVYFNSDDTKDYKFFLIPNDYDNTLGSAPAGFDPVTYNPLNWGTNILISKLLSFADYRKIYTDALLELCDSQDLFGAEGSIARIEGWQNMIRSYVPNDTGEDMSIRDVGFTGANKYTLTTPGDNNYFTAKAVAIRAAVAEDDEVNP